MACTLGNAGAIYKGCGTVYNSVESAAKSSNGRDKVVKAIYAYSNLAFQLSRGINGDNHETTVNAHKVADAAKSARTVFGLMNVFGGVITKVRSAAMTAFELLTSSDEVHLSKDNKPIVDRPKSAKYQLNTVAAGNTTHRVLGFFQSAACAVAGTMYGVSFGVCRVISFAGKMGAKLDATAKKVASFFPYFMCVNHVAVVVEHGCALKRRSERYQTLIAGDYKDNAANISTLTQEHYKESADNVLNLGEKALELAMDSQKLLKTPIPPVAMAVMSAVVATGSLARVLFIGGYKVPAMQ
ncbi:MAG: hypothetical protein S4CHLAM81_09890 [Chlamydiales bacterium]|nr:hypothetical protein [Chlamydiales bacterium]MCH9635767.1 hypothetical protein [Chlamydiales bacterium]MCH9704321.1 hypothetical protein [Chlamydiota bacterium]